MGWGGKPPHHENKIVECVIIVRADDILIHCSQLGPGVPGLLHKGKVLVAGHGPGP